MKLLRIGFAIVAVCILFFWVVPCHILAFNMQSNSKHLKGAETTFVFMSNDDTIIPNGSTITISEYEDFDFMIEMQAAIYVKNVSEDASKLSLTCVGKDNYKNIEFCPNGNCMAWPSEGNELTTNYIDALLAGGTVEQGKNWLHAMAFDSKSFRGVVELNAYCTDNTDDCATITVIFDTDASGTSSPIATGSCGDNVTYSIYSDMTMVISGTGAMTDFVVDGEGVITRDNNDYWTQVKTVTIEDGVTSIGAYAFSYCTELASVTIPSSVTSIGSDAFKGCTSLSSVTIPSSVTSIGGYAFEGCTSLSSVTIPSSMTKIQQGTFRDCASLVSVTIPSSVTEIEWGAFQNCTSLASLTIPSSVTIIRDRAFENTAWYNNQPDGLIYLNDFAYKYKGEMPESSSIAIRNGTVIISEYAFYDCTGLASVTIPNSVRYIGELAFSCPNLSSIYVESETPASIYTDVDDSENLATFYSVNKNTCVLYVPNGCKSAYENAEGWKEFQNIVEVDEPDTDISTLDNVIYVEHFEGRIGRTMDIPVKVKNTYDFRGFQFTMELPEGVTINSWELSTNRLPEGATISNKMATQKIEGNKIQVACSLSYGDAIFTGNDGEIATVNVTFSEDMEVGEYPIYLTACDISDTGGTDKKLSNIKATLVLDDYVDGDANGDGEVLIGDVVTILNYIVGEASDNINAKAADANGDGEVLIGDVITVLNIIVGL